ncbi:MAG: hypothetical protein EAZ61_01315 [Oscillatoriales cyanobacterium]|nr:MAG: hypothetical protein EAZ61_01315 [Oscillatoriales cyanobacterium]
MYLRLEAWLTCVAAIGVAEPDHTEAVATFQALDRAYRQPWRVYHDHRHLETCLALCDELRSELHCPAVVEFALWLHDAVYVPQRDDNEARSARWAEALLRRWQVRAEWRSWIVAAIWATRHREEPATNQSSQAQQQNQNSPNHRHNASQPGLERDRDLLLDIDLAILAASPPVFAQYEAAIRQEYGFISDAAFRVGRLALLQSWLNRDRLFHSAWGLDRWEQPARRNLTTAIDRLTSQGKRILV